MTKFFSVLLLTLTFNFSASADDPVSANTKPSFDEALPLLSSIEKDAIIIGKGPKTIFVFVEPMCIRSREFIDLISNSEKLQALYTYKIFVSQLSSKFDSQGLIETIYENTESAKTLISLMALSTQQTPISNNFISIQTADRIDQIQNVSYKLKAFKRPYIFVSNNGKLI